MKLKLGGIAVMLAAAVFYTFALCLVNDTEEISDPELSAEYYCPETPQEELPEESPEEAPPVITTSARLMLAAKKDIITETEPAAESVTVTTVPEEEAPPETTTAAETSPPVEDTGTEPVYIEPEEAYDQYLYGDYELFDTEEIEYAETAPAETEQEEFVTETSPAETAAEEYSEFVYEDFFAETTAVTAVSVDYGAENSTSETFTVKVDGAVRTVNAYELICQMVNREMSESFEDEAIKAQAVASYSYVKYHNVNGQTPTVVVKHNPSERIKSLVSEVWGVCCYYNGQVAQTVYMASSSGYTADAKNVWGSSIPYLKSVYCPFDVDEDPNYGDSMKVSEDRMRTLLEGSLGITLSDNPTKWLVVTGYLDGNYVGALSVDGQKTITGRTMRESVMGFDLKSAAFDVYYSDGYFYFTTYGYGHGAGMSQNGANILAKRGYSYIDILNYYFTGIEII